MLTLQLNLVQPLGMLGTSWAIAETAPLSWEEPGGVAELNSFNQMLRCWLYPAR